MKQKINFPALIMGAALLALLAGCPLEAGSPGSNGGTSPADPPVTPPSPTAVLSGFTARPALVAVGNSISPIDVNLMNAFSPVPAGASFASATITFTDGGNTVNISLGGSPPTLATILANTFNEVEEFSFSIDLDGSGATTNDQFTGSLIVAVAADPADTDFSCENTSYGYAFTEYTGSDSTIVLPDYISGSYVSVVGKGGTDKNAAVKLPNTVTTVYLPDNIRRINSYAFYGNEDLEVVYGRNVDIVGTRAFSADVSTNKGPKELFLPVAQTIEAYAFYNRTSLEKIFLPSVTSIGDYAFYKNTNLADVSIPFVNSIGGGAFYECPVDTGEDEISLPYAQTIGNYAFYESGANATVAKIDLPRARSIGAYAFYNKTALTQVTLSGASTIGTRAFAADISSSGLSVISLPNAQTIGDYAFYNRTGINSLDIRRAQTIGERAFSADVTSSGPNYLDISSARAIGDRAFYGMTNVQAVSLSSAQAIGSDIVSSNNFSQINIGSNVLISSTVSTLRWGQFINRYTGTRKRAGTYVYNSNYDDFRLN